MNKFEKSVVSLAAFTGSFAAVGGVVQAENNYPGDGDYTVRDLSDSERDMLVNQGLLTCSIKPEIRNALGVITLQEEYSERGYSRSGIDGVDGKEFCKDTYEIQVENNLYADGVVGDQMVSFLGGISSLLREHGLQSNPVNNRAVSLKTETITTPSTTVSEGCDEIHLSSWVSSRIPGSDGDFILDNGEEARAVQSALNKNGIQVGIADGKKGTRTMNGFAQFQLEKFGKADCQLGSQTFGELGIESSSTNSTEKSNAIDIDKVVIDKSDKTLTAYDNGDEVEEYRISFGDDRTYTYYIGGRQYTGTATTRTGTTKVYRTEGADYASKTLGGAPGSMGYARFFNGGLAVHVGNIWSASHGCVRVALLSMKNLVKMGFGYGDIVVVQE